MISELEVANLRRIGHARIRPDSFTVLVGANGSGKTTLLRAIEECLTGRRSLPDHVCVVHAKGRKVRRSDVPSPELQPRPIRLVPNWTSLSAPSQLSSGSALLTPSCDNLAGAIGRLILDDPDAHQHINKDLEVIVPGARRVRARPTSGNVLELRVDYADVTDVPQEALSTGTLLTIAILAAVHGEPRGKDGVVLMMDDIDVGLHPGAQEKLVAALLQVAQHDLVQIFTTTHSPYVVDAAGPENTWVLGPGKDGRSVAGRLSDHPDAAKALQVLTAGEFWGSVGEEWLRTG